MRTCRTGACDRSAVSAVEVGSTMSIDGGDPLGLWFGAKAPWQIEGSGADGAEYGGWRLWQEKTTGDGTRACATRWAQYTGTGGCAQGHHRSATPCTTMAARKAAVAAAGVLAVLYGIHRWRSYARLDPKGRVIVITG